MKTFLVVAAVLGLTSSAALAECAGHVTASAKVDKEATTASIATPAPDQPREEAAVVKRQQVEGQIKATE